MSDFLSAAVDYIRQLPLIIKYLALIASVAIEYIFPIFPGDTIVVLAGFLNAQKALGLLEISISVLLGSLIGAVAAYFFGRTLSKSHHKYLWVKKFTQSKQFATFNTWYQKWGGWFLLLNRFIPGIRAFFFFAAGAAKISFAKVLLLGAISAIIFNGCLFILGYWLGFNADLVLQILYRYSLIAYLVIILTSACLIFYFLRKKS